MNTALLDTSDLNATIAIPADGPWFEGHFPGQPILPGVAELALAIATLRQQTGKPLPLRGIAFARLRHPVLPGDRLELSARESASRESETPRLRFDLKREGLLVANGEFIVGTPLRQPDVAADRWAGTAPGEIVPPAEALLLHRPPMRFVDSILQQSGDALRCRARIPGRCALVSGGRAPAVAAIEGGAQAAAALEALQRWRRQHEAAPRLGYLVAMRDVTFFTESIPADRSLLVSVHLEAASPPLTHYRFEVSLEDLPLVRGTIGTFLGA
ncbi:MAG: ApeI family dehydratase [Betaproteobacteria bacterium]